MRFSISNIKTNSISRGGSYQIRHYGIHIPFSDTTTDGRASRLSKANDLLPWPARGPFLLLFFLQLGFFRAVAHDLEIDSTMRVTNEGTVVGWMILLPEAGSTVVRRTCFQCRCVELLDLVHI
jgi:hypothetical protein